MKKVTFLVIALFRAELAAATASNHILSYQENYPKSPHWYEFSINSYCKEHVEPISVKDFVSEKVYAGKEVRIIHIYVAANNKNCNEHAHETRSQKFTIPIDPKRMTHVYVTYDGDLTLRSGH